MFDAGMPCLGTLRLQLGQMLGLQTYSLECSKYDTHGPNEVLGTFTHVRIFTHTRTFMVHSARLMRILVSASRTLCVTAPVSLCVTAPVRRRGVDEQFGTTHAGYHGYWDEQRQSLDPSNITEC